MEEKKKRIRCRKGQAVGNTHKKRWEELGKPVKFAMIPNNLNIITLTKELETYAQSLNKQLEVEHIYYIFNLLFYYRQSTFSNNRDKFKFEEGFTPFHSKHAKEVIGQNLPHYINFLLVFNYLDTIINKNGKRMYKVGEMVYHYRINKRLLTIIKKKPTFIKIELKNHKLINNLYKSDQITDSNVNSLHKALQGIKIDTNAVIDNFKKEDYKKESEEDIINKIENINYRIKVKKNRDVYGNRFHSPFTTMNKPIKPHIKFPTTSGYTTNKFEVDIKNSQFFHMSLLNNNLFDQLNDPNFNNIQRVYNEIKDEPDYHHFMQLCQNGNIYEFVMQTYGIEERKKAKDAFIETMFTKPNTRNYLRNKMKSRFPSLIKLLNANSIENENWLPSLLQKIESYIILDCIALEILKTMNINLITIHDSIIVLPEYKELVMNKLNEVYLTKFNLLPPSCETHY